MENPTIIRLVIRLLDFASRAAGDGIFYDDCDPAIILTEAAEELGLDDWRDLRKTMEEGK